jgi:type I restriction-modification system DNA methylase subunit
MVKLMSKTILELKRIWNKEKESYATQEVGSGVQSFIKRVLECPDIFNLREGSLSTLVEKRKNEFIYEKRTRERRRADFVIYINSEIVIPVEVEQYTKIKQGEKQLARYQSDLDKKYGILTDGYTWRFYNNNIYRRFTLDEIFSDTPYFLESWNEYIKPENYYLSQFGHEVGQLPLFEKTELHIEDNRQLFFGDITTLIGSFKNKLRLEGYFNGVDKKEAEKRATEITYAYIIQFVLYKTLVDNRFEVFGDDYRSRIESIQNAIKNRSYKEILGIIDGMSYLISENIYRPFSKEQENIRSKLIRLMHKAKNELSDVSPWLDIIVFIKKYNFQNVHNEIFGYVYENYLKALYEDEKRGQYFTDPAVVNFMLEQLGYTAKQIKTKIKAGGLDRLSIVDPACGSGTFLYSATNELVKSFSTITSDTSKRIEEIVNGNVFGLDVEEFPLYLAEMNILMRMLPLILGEKYNNPVEKKIKVFLTKDSIAEFVGSGLEYADSDVGPAGEQLSYFGTVVKLPYSSYVRDEDDLAEMVQSMTSFPRRRFDYVIANPPYVPYNECSKQGILVFQLLKDDKVRLNNIYGVNLHSVPGHPKRYRPNPNLYAFFVALGLALLKDNGRLCYIIPQTLLTVGDLDVLRYHLVNYVTIEKIITFNRNLFIERGLKQTKVIPTSSLIIVISKKPPEKDNRVKVVSYTDGKDTIDETMRNISAGRKTYTKEILQSNLAENFANWNYILHDDAFMTFYQDYKVSSVDIGLYYDHKRAEREFSTRFYFDSGYSIDERRTLTEPGGEGFHYKFPKLDSKNWKIKHYRGYWPNIRTGDSPMVIKLRQANQGYNLLDSRYKVLWSYMNPVRFHLAEIPVIWARNQICAIGSENREEILYLFSVLNSSVTNRILLSQLRSRYEKDLLVSTSSIKQYVRVPIITDQNRHIKKEVINRTEEMLSLEDCTLLDYVDFSGTLVQKFEEVLIEGDTLILVHDRQKMELQIKEQTELVASSIAEQLGGQRSTQEKHRVSLHEIRNLPIVDYERQNRLKAYIDDLVFTLYFGIPLQALGLKNATKIRKACLTNQHYQYILKG